MFFSILVRNCDETYLYFIINPLKACFQMIYLPNPFQRTVFSSIKKKQRSLSKSLVEWPPNCNKGESYVDPSKSTTVQKGRACHRLMQQIVVVGIKMWSRQNGMTLKIKTWLNTAKPNNSYVHYFMSDCLHYQ